MVAISKAGRRNGAEQESAEKTEAAAGTHEVGRGERTGNGSGARAGQKPGGRRGRKPAPGPGLVVERRWTTAGVDPFEAVEWDYRTAAITGEKGETIFEQRE